MLRKENILRISIITAIAAWLAMLGTGFIIRFGLEHDSHAGANAFFIRFFLVVFIVAIYVFYRNKIGSQGSFDIIDILWKVFVTGLVATVVSLSTRFFLNVLSSNELGQNTYLLDTLYLLNTALITTFLIATFIVWKRLILYQKSKWLVRSWNIFEYGLIGVAIFFFTNNDQNSIYELTLMGLLTILSIILSVNLKWVAYLNFKQKWKSILLILLICLYIGYFYTYLVNFGSDKDFIPVIDIIGLITISQLFIFTLIYCVFSILVVLFNLPTSSVFEQKLVEVVNFQKLSQSRNTGQNEEQVYGILLDSSVSVTIANAAWLDIMNEKADVKETIYYKTNKKEKEEIIAGIINTKIKPVQTSMPGRFSIQKRFVAELRHDRYKSILVIPVFIQEEHVATLALVKDVNDGFTREMIEIVRTFINQASISIENYRLMEEAIKNERYKEELKIAKRVQDSLLPKALHTNPDFEIASFSKAAAEVGGDYFDTYRISDSRMAIVVGDVSGKGTSAAFHMSQMKGIFHSLVQLNLSIRDFIIRANHALSGCLDRTSYITIVFIILDMAKNTFEFARAGHCPTLYYSNKEDNTRFIEDNGLGLGILRDEQFDEFVEVNEISYHSGDILVLYTDGITEAKNVENEEFGYDRLLETVRKNTGYSAEYIKESVIKALYDFCGNNTPDDDVTALIIKFK